MRKLFLLLLKAATAVIGARVVDQRTGRVIGKALFLPWRGKLHIIGLEDKRVIPAFESQQRLTYWNQAMTFSTHPEPDFPNERKADDSADPPG
jgi:hypothetical protein